MKKMYLFCIYLSALVVMNGAQLFAYEPHISTKEISQEFPIHSDVLLVQYTDGSFSLINHQKGISQQVAPFHGAPAREINAFLQSFSQKALLKKRSADVWRIARRHTLAVRHSRRSVDIILENETIGRITLTFRYDSYTSDVVYNSSIILLKKDRKS